MEHEVPLSYYWTAVKRRVVVIIVVAGLCALVAYGVVVRSKPGYEVHFSYIVSLAQREKAQEYRFDGYYALQATDLFTATLASWVKAPEIGVSAYEEAGIVAPSDPREVIKAISAEKTAPQLVQVTVKSNDKHEAEALAAGLREVVVRNVDRYRDQGVPELTFRVVATDPWVGMVRPGELLVAVATGLFVLVVGVNLVVFLAAVRLEK